LLGGEGNRIMLAFPSPKQGDLPPASMLLLHTCGSDFLCQASHGNRIVRWQTVVLIIHDYSEHVVQEFVTLGIEPIIKGGSKCFFFNVSSSKGNAYISVEIDSTRPRVKFSLWADLNGWKDRQVAATARHVLRELQVLLSKYVNEQNWLRWGN